MLNWYYIALFFITNKIYSPIEVKCLPFWIKEVCESESCNFKSSEIKLNGNGVLDYFYKKCNENKSELTKIISDEVIQFLSKADSFLKGGETEEHILFLNPEFIYFISESFRPIFLTYKEKFNENLENNITKIKDQMYSSWEEKIELFPVKVYEYLLIKEETEKDFISKIRNLFVFIFKNPLQFQIIHFYEDQLPEQFTNELINQLDDKYLCKYFSLLNKNKGSDKNSCFDDNILLNKESEISKNELTHFEKHFKSLLLKSDILPVFSELKLKKSIKEIVEDYLVKRGNIKDLKAREKYFNLMVRSLNNSGNREMSDSICNVNFKSLREEHIKKRQDIHDYLIKMKNIEKYLTSLDKVRKRTFHILKFNYVRSLMKQIRSQNSNKNPRGSSNPFYNMFSLFKKEKSSNNKISENDQIEEEEEMQKRITNYIRKPQLLKEIFREYIDLNKESGTNSSKESKSVNIFSVNTSKETHEIVYDWNTYLIFNLVKYITFDKFLEIRKESKILDLSYENLFIANYENSQQEENEDENNQLEEDDDDNDNDKEKVTNNIYSVDDDDDVENKYNDTDNDTDNNEIGENEKYLNDKNEINYIFGSGYRNNDHVKGQCLKLVNELKNAFSGFTNPIQKVIDVYTALKNLSDFFLTGDGKDHFNELILKYEINMVTNSGILFNIFDFFSFPNFVSSMIFMFDYYFMLFQRSSQMKILFLQIYNYGIKKYYPKDKLHFDIVSSEEKLYQHLLLSRNFINVIYIGSSHKTKHKNSILKNILRKSVSGPNEEDEIYPLEEFIETAKEVTYTFFKNSTYYICSITLKKFEDEFFDSLENEMDKKFIACIIAPETLLEIDKVNKVVKRVKDIKFIHIVCPFEIENNYLEIFKESAIIHNLKLFDIKNIF